MKLITRYCRSYAGRMLFGFLIKITGTFADLGLPWVLSYILDEVVRRRRFARYFFGVRLCCFLL